MGVEFYFTEVWKGEEIRFLKVCLDCDLGYWRGDKDGLIYRFAFMFC